MVILETGKAVGELDQRGLVNLKASEVACVEKGTYKVCGRRD